MALLFHGDDDLTEVRPDIFSYGVTDFESQMTEAEAIIIRVLDARWYREQANDRGIDWRSTPFDETLLLNVDTHLRRLAVYKSLELIYIYLMKESPEPDAFERQSNTFKKLYRDELNEVLTAGIDYDWDDSGDVGAGEIKQPSIRRLYRV